MASRLIPQSDESPILEPVVALLGGSSSKGLQDVLRVIEQLRHRDSGSREGVHQAFG